MGCKLLIEAGWVGPEAPRAGWGKGGRYVDSSVAYLFVGGS
jgi:hypothetical protein